MYKEGEGSNSRDIAVDEFLAHFNGDAQAATTAVHRRVQELNDGHTRIEVSRVSSSTQTAPPRTDSPIISVESIKKQYKLGKQTVQALNDVTLRIYPGEFVAIVGPSGSGKSTLLQLIGCLDTPTEGVVTVDGKNTAKLGDAALSNLRRQTIGFIFQSFYLQPFLRLADNIAVPAMFTSKKRQQIQEETTALLEKVGLSDRARHFPKELSGGQIQRAAIARALVNKPKIILADEPTGNLDTANSEAIIDVFKTIRDTLGTTIVVVTHNAEVAAQADRIIRLTDGKVAE